ncbi:nuclear transport factor 2 family protein [Nitriliruptoraceae bacterium ZYF776]|nr:nuclear transport factor 2 family protein [Profundirhabdus halotolerans]
MDEVLELERQGWEALSTDGVTARAFYDDHLADEVTMLLPGGMRLDDREQILDAMSGAPWAWHELHDETVLPLGDDARAVTYRVRAQRGDQDVYEALIASTFVRRGGGWKLILHQQTPV